MGAQVSALRPSQGAAAESVRVDAWSSTTLPQRLKMLRRLRDLLAQHADALAEAIPPDLARNRADSLAAEILPLLEACKFLEREAARILAPRRLGKRGLPFWLAGVDSTVERVALGTILMIAPANYPLFLPGVQALQALAAGNRVVWKPGRGGAAVAHLFARLAAKAGLPEAALRVTEDSVEAAIAEIHARPDKIVFTGSSAAGREVMRLAADQAIPVTAELSGCDAVIALPSAQTARLIDALCFGMRLNGSATCMAPRRLILVGEHHQTLLAELQTRFAAMEPVFIGEHTRQQLRALLADAETQGAQIWGEVGDLSMKPVLVLGASAEMEVCQTDVFAPVLAVIHARNTAHALQIEQTCPFGLTAAIFGDETDARALGHQLEVGTVLINDLIVPTADPRVPFGGRRGSGFGVTRGREGLLEMTAVKTTLVRRNQDRKHLQPTTGAHEELFRGVVALGHRSSFGARWAGLKQSFAAVQRLGKSTDTTAK
jgi:aldehyde dehydrogenase (NAD+)